MKHSMHYLVYSPTNMFIHPSPIWVKSVVSVLAISTNKELYMEASTKCQLTPDFRSWPQVTHWLVFTTDKCDMILSYNNVCFHTPRDFRV